MVQAGQQPLLSLCFPGQEQPGPSSLGTHSTFACTSQKPQAKLSPNTEALWPVPPLRACPCPGSVAAGPSSAPKPAARGTRAGLNPSSPIPNAAAWLRTHPQASPPPSLPLQPPALAGGDVSGGTEQKHPPDTHTFQRLYPSESNRLENSSYSSIFIFFGYNFSFGHVIN